MTPPGEGTVASFGQWWRCPQWHSVDGYISISDDVRGQKVNSEATLWTVSVANDCQTLPWAPPLLPFALTESHRSVTSLFCKARGRKASTGESLKTSRPQLMITEMHWRWSLFHLRGTWWCFDGVWSVWPSMRHPYNQKKKKNEQSQRKHFILRIIKNKNVNSKRRI